MYYKPTLSARLLGKDMRCIISQLYQLATREGHEKNAWQAIDFKLWRIVISTPIENAVAHMHTHANTHMHKCKMQILLQPLVVMRTRQSQDACALSRHCESCKQSSWSWARNLQENRPFLTGSGVGTRSPTWTIAVPWEKALNLHPSKCQVPNHSWVDWWGW